ncbi:MAG: M28 family peptidase [Gemmatimonadota bacterium]
MKRSSLVALILLPAALSAQTQSHPLKYSAKPTVAAITPADLMSRLYGFADDSMMGRKAGTVYHDKGVDYIARELTRLGLKPGGENGTYFQHIPLMLHNLVPAATFTVDGRSFVSGTDFLARDAADFEATARELQGATAVYGGMFPDTANMIKPDQATGKVVVFTVPRGWQANRSGLVGRYLMAAGVVVATLDSMPGDVRDGLSQPSIYLNKGPYLLQVPAFFYSTRAMAEAMLGGPLSAAVVGAAGKTVTGSLKYTDARAPGSRNVIAILPGSDRKLAGQYVALGAHSDHVDPSLGQGDFSLPIDHDSLWAFYHVVRPNGADDGAKPPTPADWPRVTAKIDSLRKLRAPRPDSIFNGADDDGSGSMGLLEVAEAFATGTDKPKRSLLFIWHVGEEEGLWGSGHFTDYPTVPRDSITSQINIDMIGRGGAQDLQGGGPGYVQLIGSRRLSTELGDLVEAEGTKFTNPPFKFDYQFDANGHPQQFYCRSDHYNYARYGIPVVFMSTGGHPEYHQVTDEPQYIDYDQLARVSQLVFNTARAIGNREQRLVVDKPKPDPKGQCRQ